MQPDSVFIALISVLSVWGVLQFQSLAKIARNRQLVEPLCPIPADLWWFFLVAVGISCLRFAWGRWAKPYARRVFTSKQWSPATQEVKVTRFSEMSFKTIYFIVISVSVTLYVRQQPWCPPELGGVGTPVDLWTNFPQQRASGPVKWYYVMAGGYHLSSLFFQLLERPLPDFWTTLLQTLLAVALVTSSYLSNYLRIGAILMVTHDICDIFTCGCRVVVDTGSKPLIVGLFSCLIGFWGYLRLYCFSKIVLYPFFKYIHELIPTGEIHCWSWFAFLLLTLFLLDVYWFSLLIWMMWHFATSGRTEELPLRPSNVQETYVPKKPATYSARKDL